MDSRISRGRAIPIVCACYVAGAAGHHSDTPHFFMDQNIRHEGIVTEFRFVNPHAYVYFDQTDADGVTEHWKCELPAATSLRRQDWSENSLLPGQSITIEGSPARREDNHCYVNAFVLDDGTVVPRQDAGPVLVVEGPQSQRPSRLVNGQPNISGDWVTRRGSGSRELPGQTAAALAAAEVFEYEYDHPSLRCESVGIIHGWRQFGRFVNRIIQAGEEIRIVYGYMDMERTIHLDIAEHPGEMVYTTAGHSIGRWEGDVLVVDTAGISAGAVFPLGEIMHRDQYHVVERFWYDEESGMLVREYTADDPLYFTGQYSGRDESDISGVPYSPYDCVELSGKNNQRTAL